MRKLLFLVLMGLSLVGKGNMGEPPEWDGTKSAMPFTSKFVDILHEKIEITPIADSCSALFEIEYTLNAMKDGKQIPLIFYAKEFKNDFKIWLDGEEICFSPIDSLNIDQWIADYNLDLGQWSDGKSRVNILWRNDRIAEPYLITELSCFKVDLSKGKHLIKVKYYSNCWLDFDDWVNSYSYRYSLSPAENWKSFGQLDIYLNRENNAEELESNLDDYAYLKEELSPVITHWCLKGLPEEKVIEFVKVSQVNWLAKSLIFIHPIGLSIISFVLFIWFHFKQIRKYRLNHLQKRYSYVVITGGILIPFLVMLLYMLYFPLIDFVIGEAATEYHGYTFLVFLLYPIVMPVYWLCMIGVDRYYKERVVKKE